MNSLIEPPCVFGRNGEKSERKEREIGEIPLPEKVFRGKQDSPTPSRAVEAQSWWRWEKYSRIIHLLFGSGAIR